MLKSDAGRVANEAIRVLQIRIDVPGDLGFRRVASMKRFDGPS